MTEQQQLDYNYLDYLKDVIGGDLSKHDHPKWDKRIIVLKEYIRDNIPYDELMENLTIEIDVWLNDVIHDKLVVQRLENSEKRFYAKYE